MPRIKKTWRIVIALEQDTDKPDLELTDENLIDEVTNDLDSTEYGTKVGEVEIEVTSRTEVE